MEKNRIPVLRLENCQIIFKNFSGVETQFNRSGDRNFCVIFDDPQLVAELIEDGWNVRELKKRDEDDEQKFYLEVKVSYKAIPPKIFTVCRGVKTLLTEETVGELDYALIENVDLAIRPYSWEVNGKTGIKAYCKTMYVTIEGDEFADKYGDDPLSDIVNESPF